MRSRLLAIACLSALSAVSASFAAPSALGAPPRPAEPPTKKAPREPEPSPPARRSPADFAPLHLDRTLTPGGCSVYSVDRLRTRLLALQNDSEVMSLELWGDAKDYGPFQKVLFHVRVPRAAYVTLYWLGPEGYVVVPLDNVRVPAEREVVIDTGGIIVPPYGREQWVAIATLESFPLVCGSDAVMLAQLERRLKTVHGIGRWEVRSLESGVPRE